MNKAALAAAGALLLAGCAHEILTPERCERALRAADTADRILAILIEQGVEPRLAAKLRDGLLVGQLTVAAACATADSSSSPGT